MAPANNRILCVDGHADTCELITTFLKDHEVVSAHSKADALLRACASHASTTIFQFEFNQEGKIQSEREFTSGSPEA